MMLEDTNVPRLTGEEAARLVRRRYDLKVSPSPLPSYADQNFRLETGEGESFVLKIHHAAEQSVFVEAQILALDHICAWMGDLEVTPRVLSTTDGERVFEHTANGARHLVRLLSWVPGLPLAEIEPVTPNLLTGLGHLLGRLDMALSDFSHPGVDRYMPWDLVNVLDARKYAADIPTQGRQRVEGILDRLEEELVPRFSELRPGVIHGDANDYNLLVDNLSPGPARVTGIIDFGDMVRSRVVCEPAIAMTYVMLGEADPVAAALPVLEGYQDAYALTAFEIGTLADLVLARLCISVSMSAHEKRRNPENEYITIQERAVWGLLARLHEADATEMTDRFLSVCGDRD